MHMQAVCGPARSEVSLESFVTKLEDTPIAVNGGKKHALNDAERMLLMQQDELRRLRGGLQATSAQAPLSAPRLPSGTSIGTPSSSKRPETSQESADATVSIAKGGVLLQSASEAEAAAGGQPMEGPGGIFNIVGVMAAGVLGGLLYQSNQGQKRVKDEMDSKIAEQQKVRSFLPVCRFAHCACGCVHRLDIGASHAPGCAPTCI